MRRARIDVNAEIQPARPFAHLAIRPYPQELKQVCYLKCGIRVLLRPIRPQDEPLWHQMVTQCSLESIRFRFRYLFQAMSHEMAARYCFIDYDRELALVAEIEQMGKREIIGVVHLVCDADHSQAEYAILVADQWQGKGLGTELTRCCLSIAASWGLRKVTGETERHNHRMLSTFRRFGFDLTYGEELDDPVLAVKHIAAARVVPRESEISTS